MGQNSANALRETKTSPASSQLSNIYAGWRPLPPFQSCKGFLDNNNNELFVWSKNNPDRNPIENLWTNMKNKVSKEQPPFDAELVKVMKEVWVKEISKEYCQRLIKRMLKRMEAVIKNRKGHNKC